MKHFNEIVSTARTYATHHKAEIFTGLGIAGMIGTVVSAVKATPKAVRILDEYAYRQTMDGEYTDDYKVSVPETVKLTWKEYVPTVCLGGLSIMCIIGAQNVNSRRITALSTAYKLSETAFHTYKDKVIETIGQEKEKQVREKVTEDKVANTDTNLMITGTGKVLCLDQQFGTYFESTVEDIKRALNKVNADLLHEDFASVNDFYYELGLEPIKAGRDLGWNMENGLIEIVFDSRLAKNDIPCVVIDYLVAPRKEYQKLM